MLKLTVHKIRIGMYFSLMSIVLAAINITCVASNRNEISGTKVKRIIQNNDGHAVLFYKKPPIATSDILYWIDIYKNSDIEIVEWDISFTSRNYDDVDTTGLPRTGDKWFIANLRNLKENPFKIVVNRAHDIGLKIFAAIRAGHYYPEPGECEGWGFDWSVYNFMNGAFYNQHRHLRVIDQHGTPQPSLSYAYPEVCEYYWNLAIQAANAGVDGITLDFLREPPFIGYDKTLVEEYEKDFRKKPAPDDKKWQQYQADRITDFLRQLRKKLDTVEHRANKKIALAVRVDHTNYYQQALDVNIWIKEGLIDIVIPSDEGVETFYRINNFIKMVEGTKTKLYPCIHAATYVDPHYTDKQIKAGKVERIDYLNRDRYKDRTLELHDAGADGIALFNNANLRGILDELAAVSQLKRWSGSIN